MYTMCLKVSGLSQSITNYTLTTINTGGVTLRFMAAKLTRLTHKIAIQLRLVAESCIICSSRSKAASPESFGYTLLYACLPLILLVEKQHKGLWQ
jgi:hypothetical protein